METKDLPIIAYGQPKFEANAKIVFSVTDYEDIYISKHTSYAVYVLKIETSYKQWTVQHRYSSFRKLHKYLLKKHKQMNLPKFPDKKLFNQDTAVKEKRKKALNEYFKGLYSIFDLELLEDNKM